MNFYKFNGTNVGDIVDYIKRYLDEHEGEYVLMIGVDSLPHGFIKKKATFTQVVALHRKINGIGKGAHCLFRRQAKIQTRGTRDRLLKEAYQLVEVAQYLRDSDIEFDSRILKVDLQLDFNKEKPHESEKYLDEAAGYVRAMGFEVNVKPDAPAASYAADFVCRYKNEK